VAKAGGAPDLVARARRANTALEVLEMARADGLDLGCGIAEAAWRVAAKALQGTDIALEIAVFDRQGRLIGRTEFRPVH
jgi:cobalt-precorrin-5B (C1)-methyltransferase